MPSGEKEYRFSATDVRNAIKCPRLFLLNKKFRIKPSYHIGLGIGNLVHNTLEDFVKILNDPKKLYSFLSKSMSRSEIQRRCDEELYKIYRRKIQGKMNKIQHISAIEKAWALLELSIEKFAIILKKSADRFPIKEIPKNIILATEKSFKIPLKIQEQKFILTGRIDLILRDPESLEPIIFDYKTGSAKNILQDCIQLVCYSMGIEREFNEKNEIRILYFFDDGLRDVELPPSEDLKPHLFSLLLEMANWLENYPTRIIDEQLCKTCPMRTDCYKIFDGIKQPEEVKSGIISRIKSITKPSVKTDMSSELIIGKELKTKDDVILDKKKLTRHLALIGSSGSGKTVLAKVIIEELLKSGTSILIIDPQGDLASLVISNNSRGQELLANIDKVIFTPGSNKGINLILDPFADPPEDKGIDKEDYREFKLALLDNISLNLLSILNLDPAKNKEEKSFLEAVINEIWNRNERPSFTKIANYVKELDYVLPVDGGEKISIELLLSSQKRKKICSLLLSYAVGTDGVLFRDGIALDLDEIENGKPKLYIVHLEGIGTDIKKRQIVLSWIIRSIYNWMLKHPPKDENARLLFYIDEVSDFLPPHPRNPASKKMISILLRQARKYGISCMLATQSPGDIDYKALDNVLSLFVGRIPTKQSKEKIADLTGPKFSEVDVMRKSLNNLMRLKQGEFLFITENQDPLLFKTRWVLTEHKVLGLDEVAKLYREKQL